MSKRSRRKRFTVIAEGEHRVVLAYDAQDAKNYYTARGYTVTEVREGDYRFSGRPSGDRPEHKAIAEAIAFLGIKHPVDIKVTAPRAGQYGAHRIIASHPRLRRSGQRMFGASLVRADAADWMHKITVKSHLGVEQIGETLWHELVHALQFERDVLDVLPARATVLDALTLWRTQYRDGTRYSFKAQEVEANSYMSHNAELPLAR